MQVNVLIAEDHAMVRSGLRALLEGNPDTCVVGESGDGESAVRLAGELSPQVVVMDLNLPVLNGVEATRRIVQDRPGVKVVAVSGQCNQQAMTEALRAGACGFVPKEAAFEELAQAIAAAVEGRTYISPRVAGMVVDHHVRGTTAGGGEARSGEGRSAFRVLTPREREVLQLVTEGRTAKQIGNQLGIAVKTVETHRRQLMEKLGIDSIAELTKYAIREGITSPEF